jgi:hypothetical protein
MAKNTRKPAAILAIALGLAAPAGDANANELPRLTVVMRIYNYANVPPGELTAARARAGRVYRAIGVDIVWSDTAAAATALVLLPQDMTEKKCQAENIADGVLGRGAAATRRAYVFYERVTAAARRANVDRRAMLGKVIAHEIGHVLLDEPGHARDGIMRATLDTRSLEDRFTPAQAGTIRAALMNGRTGL